MTGIEDHARSIFFDALEHTGEDLEAYVKSACASDDRLRQRVDELLQAHRALENPDKPSLARGTPHSRRSLLLEGPGTIIGQYRLLEQIGEGGFGIVYMAEQLEPVRRKVALKIIKPGMDTRLVVARFEAERQALALMDHPNIARVFDGGATETGRPYFVMELVNGIPITDFCDRSRLPIRDRIELFVTVCKAVQHAHQKGIIHRDLKPNNVLVTLHDDKPVVKVIDFGIAKAIGQQLTEKTLFTNFAQMIGTPLYMSPEQAQLSGLDVDTRSDIYAMGVLLYELLTGTTPFDQERMRTLAFDEIRKLIHEVEPPRPSSRLTARDEATTTASFKRGSDPRRLSQLIRGELDWIVMKCLEKDRNRRYETANGLAMDLARYLRNEPVHACPPALVYRARTFIRRHRASIGMAASLLAIALLGAALTIWQAVRAAAAHDAENQAKLALSIEQQAAAEERANEIARQLETLNKANSLIESARSHVDFSEWESALASLNKALALRKDHSSVWATRGDLYARLTLWDLAGSDFKQAHALQEPGSVTSLYLQALLRLQTRDEDGYHRICNMMASGFGAADDPRAWEREEVARACLHAQTPVISPQRLVALCERANDAGKTSVRLLSLATAYFRAGQYELALSRLNEARDHVPRDAGVWTNSMLAMTHFRLGQPEPARAALDAAAKELGGRFIARGRVLGGNLPSAWWIELHEIQFFREASLLIEGREPKDDPRQWYVRGRVLLKLGNPREAIAAYSHAVELDPKYSDALARRTEIYHDLGDWTNLFEDLEKRRLLQPKDPQVANDLSWCLATCPIPRYRNLKRAIELGDLTVKLGPYVANFWNTLGVVKYRAGEWKNAMNATLKSMELSRAGTYWDWYNLALCQWRLDHRERARQLLVHAYRRTPPEAIQDPFFLEFRNEAEALIGQRASTSGGSWDDPAAFTLLLEIVPEAPWIYELRASVCIRQKQWDQAAADLARVTRARPKDHHAWYGQAAARLGARDLEGYRKARQGIIANFRDDTNLAMVGHVCYVSAALPATPEEMQALLKMADFAASKAAPNLRLRGAMNFRAGNYQATIDDFTAGMTAFPRRAWDWLFLAMAHQKLGQIGEARKELAQAVDWIERVNRRSSGGSTINWISWFEPLEVEQILKEAKQIVE